MKRSRSNPASNNKNGGGRRHCSSSRFAHPSGLSYTVSWSDRRIWSRARSSSSRSPSTPVRTSAPSLSSGRLAKPEERGLIPLPTPTTFFQGPAPPNRVTCRVLTCAADGAVSMPGTTPVTSSLLRCRSDARRARPSSCGIRSRRQRRRLDGSEPPPTPTTRWF